MKSDESPARMDIDPPPEAVAPGPPIIEILPEAPLIAFPVMSDTTPLLPSLAVPEDIDTLPDVPEIPPLAERIFT